jgi:hypothetical protein
MGTTRGEGSRFGVVGVVVARGRVDVVMDVVVVVGWWVLLLRCGQVASVAWHSRMVLQQVNGTG